MVNINLNNFSRTIDFVSDFISDIKTYINNSRNKQEEIERNIKNEVLEKPSLIVDRIEGDGVVCEILNNNEFDKIKVVNIDKAMLPINIKEGNILKYNNGKYSIDFESSNLLKENIKEITKDLWKN